MKHDNPTPRVYANVIEWSFGNGDVSLSYTKDGLYVEGFYYSDQGERNNEIGPGFISWEELGELRKKAVEEE